MSTFRRLIPTLNRILVKRVEQVPKSAGGILLKTDDDKSLIGEVVETGPGAYDQNGKLVPLAVKKGDNVLLPEFGSVKVKLADGEFHVYRDTEILGILQK